MELSYDLISQFAKVVNKDDKQKVETTIYGTVVDQNGNKPGKDENGNKIVIDETGGKYFKPDGSDQLIPITENDADIIQGSTTTNTDYGDRTSVLIKNHTATVTGNISSPSASNKDVETKISEFDIAVGEQIQANKAYFKDLTADKANLGNLVAAIISVAELIAKDADIEKLVADNATITDLIATKIDADVVIADNAIIEHLKASTIDVLSLIADKSVIEDLIANNADLNSVEAKNAYLKYANVDFSNIGEATISKLFTDYGVIKELIIENGTVVKELIGVTIKGDLIEAGTLKADKLVVKGSDGLYYKLNIEAGVTSSEEVTEEELQNGLHGTAIIAKTITAEKIAVDDLVAFGATIGGFHITDKSLYSGVKESVDNTTRGIYMDNNGQFAAGDATNYVKYYKNTDGSYDLEISADKMTIGSSRKNVEEEITPIKQISGNPIFIDDISSVPHNISCSITRETLDNLTNHIPYPFTDTTKTVNGITFTDNGDGSITVNGQLTGEFAQFLLYEWDVTNNDFITLMKSDNTFYFGCDGWDNSYGDCYAIDDSNVYYAGTNIQKPLISTMFRIGIGILSTEVFDNVILRPKIIISPKVTRYGKNLFDINAGILDAGGSFTVNKTERSISTNVLAYGESRVIFDTKYPSGQYSFSADYSYDSTKRLLARFYDFDGNIITDYIDVFDAYNAYYQAHTLNADAYNTFTVPSTVAYWYLGWKPTGANDGDPSTLSNPQLELGPTVTDYEQSIEPQRVMMDSEGSFKGLTSVYPYTTIIVDRSDTILNCEYYKNTTFGNLEGRVITNEESISGIYKTNESIIASVSNIETSVDHRIQGVEDSVETVKSKVDLAMTSDQVKIEIQNEVAKGTNKVVTTVNSFKFDDEGLIIDKSGTEMKTEITEDGMQVFKNDNAVLTANNEGVKARNLRAYTYLIIGSNSRLENYGNNRTGCFWVGE